MDKISRSCGAYSMVWVNWIFYFLLWTVAVVCSVFCGFVYQQIYQPVPANDVITTIRYTHGCAQLFRQLWFNCILYRCLWGLLLPSLTRCLLTRSFSHHLPAIPIRPSVNVCFSFRLIHYLPSLCVLACCGLWLSGTNRALMDSSPFVIFELHTLPEQCYMWPKFPREWVPW